MNTVFCTNVYPCFVIIDNYSFNNFEGLIYGKLLQKGIFHQFNNIPYFLQMDSQNKELVHENELLQEQVDILRERLQALPALASKEIFRLSQQVRNFITSCRWNTLIACK